jgi:importin-5
MRSFSLVLLRRLLLRAQPGTQPGKSSTLYDSLPAQTLAAIERLLLHAIAHERTGVVRRKAADTVIDVANRAAERGRPWHALQVQAFAMVAAQDDPGARESAFAIFAGCPILILDLQTETVLQLLQKGLQDPSSLDVCLFLSLLVWLKCSP